MTGQCEHTFLKIFLALGDFAYVKKYSKVFPKYSRVSASGCRVTREVNQDLKTECARRASEQAIKVHYLFINEISQSN